MTPNLKAAYFTLGCKLNFTETSTIARNLARHGVGKVEFEAGADIYVINTCSVTDKADKKCRNIVRKALRFNPNAFVIVIGCYAQLKPNEIAAIKGVDLVLGAQEKFNIQDFLQDLSKKGNAEIEQGHIKEVKEFNTSFSTNDRTRAFLKVQDGCNYFCAFCTIPLARGRSRNENLENTLKVARKIAASPAREIVLTGVNIGDFGNGKNETFYDLIKALDQLEGIDRFRISSIEPNLLTDEIIDFVANSKKFVPHFHIPLQSGSDEILISMRRKYDSNLYTQRISKIKERMPQACIGVDVIVGFPGEDENRFQTTYNYLKDLPVSYLHVFTYSERDNTTALRLKEIVPMPLREERSKLLRILSLKKQREFYQSQLGNTLPVLWESKNENNMLYGFTTNYLKVTSTYDPAKINRIENVLLENINVDGVMEGSLEEIQNLALA